MTAKLNINSNIRKRPAGHGSERRKTSMEHRKSLLRPTGLLAIYYNNVLGTWGYLTNHYFYVQKAFILFGYYEKICTFASVNKKANRTKDVFEHDYH